MDFASLMKSQISSASPKEQPGGGPKKYLKRSEVEAQRQADYHREQEELEKARLERLEKKRKWDEEEAERNAARDEKRKRLADDSKRVREEEDWREENERRKRIGLPGLPAPGSESNQGTPALKDGEEDIPEEDLLEKLKEMGEPRYLFAESHLQRLRRYRALTSKALAPKLSSGPIPTTLELVEEKHMKIPSHVPQSAEEKAYLRRQLASYFDMVLSEWAQALARRAREVKESLSGRKAQQNYEAAKDNLRPLFRKLETNTLSDSILAAVVEITHLAQLKQYVFANDAYLRLSIGKAAWPIGVTMVGIHERSAREKLHETDKEGKGEAHIMSDEVTRKMLQGIKRCLSFAQTRWPPGDVAQLMG